MINIPLVELKKSGDKLKENMLENMSSKFCYSQKIICIKKV
jgi:hypothetical protein